MERNDRISVRKSRRGRVDKIEELKVKRLSGLERFTGVFRNGHTGEALSVEWSAEDADPSSRAVVFTESPTAERVRQRNLVSL